MLKQPIVCLMGPTACGKTDLAIKLIQHFPMEIISVDSAMVYCGMNIGTSKPSEDILQIAPHRLIDVIDPKESYSAGQFRNQALFEIKDILQRGKIPLLVGGTMLYFRALIAGLATLPKKDEQIRASLQTKADELGWAYLHKNLMKIDPLSAERIHPSDSQRIQRALEVYLLTGKPISTWQANETAALSDYRVLNLVIMPEERVILHNRIQTRFKEMLQAGFIDEVKQLYLRGDLHADLPSIRSVGYRQIWAYLDGKLDKIEMEERALIATRQLAKHQLTWLRRWPDDKHVINEDNVFAVCKQKVANLL